MASVRLTSNHFPEFNDEVRSKTSRALALAGHIMERKAAERAPFQFGTLRNSIGSSHEGMDGMHVTCYADAWYALYQEGAPYHRRFLESSLDEAVAQLPAIIKGV